MDLLALVSVWALHWPLCQGVLILRTVLPKLRSHLVDVCIIFSHIILEKDYSIQFGIKGNVRPNKYRDTRQFKSSPYHLFIQTQSSNSTKFKHQAKRN
jgi:hypothetical protein